MIGCIYRRQGLVTMRMMCSEKNKMGPCPWWRAAWCVPADLVAASIKALGKMLLGKE